LRDEQVVQAFRRGRGSMPAIPVPEDKVKDLLDSLFELDLTAANRDDRQGTGTRTASSVTANCSTRMNVRS
jgi:hypothetical protein